MLFGLFKGRNSKKKKQKRTPKAKPIPQKPVLPVKSPVNQVPVRRISEILGIQSQPLTKQAFIIHMQDTLDEFRQAIEDLYIKGGSVRLYPQEITNGLYTYPEETPPEKATFAMSPKDFLQEGYALVEKFACKFLFLADNMNFLPRQSYSYSNTSKDADSFYKKSYISCICHETLSFSVAIEGNSSFNGRESFEFTVQLIPLQHRRNTNGKWSKPHFRPSFGETSHALSKKIPYRLDYYLGCRQYFRQTNWENGFEYPPSSIQEEAVRMSTTMSQFIYLAKPAFLGRNHSPLLKQALLTIPHLAQLPSHFTQHKKSFVLELDTLIGTYIKGILHHAEKAKEQQLSYEDTINKLREYHLNFSEYEAKSFYQRHRGLLKVGGKLNANEVSYAVHRTPKYIRNCKITQRAVLTIWNRYDVLFSFSAKGLQIYPPPQKKAHLLNSFLKNGATSPKFIQFEPTHWEQENVRFAWFVKKSFYFSIGYNYLHDTVKELLIPLPYRLGIFSNEVALKNYLSETYDVFIKGLLLNHSMIFVTENFLNDTEKKQVQEENTHRWTALINGLFSSGLQMKTSLSINSQYNFEDVMVDINFNHARVPNNHVFTQTTEKDGKQVISYSLPRLAISSYLIFSTHQSKAIITADALHTLKKKTDILHNQLMNNKKVFVELAGYDYVEEITPQMLYGTDDDLFYPRIE